MEPGDAPQSNAAELLQSGAVSVEAPTSSGELAEETPRTKASKRHKTENLWREITATQFVFIAGIVALFAWSYRPTLIELFAA